MTLPQLDTALDRFVACLRTHLDAGARGYGGRSFTRPAAERVAEIQQELDVAGLGLILWLRRERLRGAAERLAPEEGK